MFSRILSRFQKTDGVQHMEYLTVTSAYQIFSAVSSGVLTLRGAVLVAGVCKFVGATFMGASVTSTVHKGIVDPRFYTERPEFFMLGMWCADMLPALLAPIHPHGPKPPSRQMGCSSSLVKMWLPLNPAKSLLVHWQPGGACFPGMSRYRVTRGITQITHG